jgi:hypothetical protein
MHSTCSDFCPAPGPCVLGWFAPPCICNVVAGGVAPTLLATQAPAAEEPRAVPQQEPQQWPQ